ncbi:ribokinase [Photobacterium sanctipauli]|uniref:Ribokinase n=1 Tax=Photobacterium sanctipauli TaxID=1342794 RepID=A0A2T3NWJ6_9GAMM|nr:ribokinase [Photobacterium sanctipauli]PSW20660.1 ribokinase [Photobacterium sanctipauli]
MKQNTGLFILGSINIDFVSLLSDFPKPGQTMIANSSFTVLGGKGANQAIAASKANRNVIFLAKTGNDALANIATKRLEQERFDSLLIHRDENSLTGRAFIQVSELSGENKIVLDLGANLALSEQELGEYTIRLSGCAVALTQLENNFQATHSFLQSAKSHGVLTVLNPAPYSDEVISLLPLVDVLTPNETEAQDISGIEITDLESAKLAAQAIHNKGVSTVILTLGAKGCLYFDGAIFEFFPSIKAEVLDTSGAGDAFNGSFAASLAQGKSIRESLQYATAFASLAVERKGASNMPNHQEALNRQQGN